MNKKIVIILTLVFITSAHSAEDAENRRYYVSTRLHYANSQNNVSGLQLRKAILDKENISEVKRRLKAHTKYCTDNNHFFDTYQFSDDAQASLDETSLSAKLPRMKFIGGLSLLTLSVGSWIFCYHHDESLEGKGLFNISMLASALGGIYGMVDGFSHFHQMHIAYHKFCLKYPGTERDAAIERAQKIKELIHNYKNN